MDFSVNIEKQGEVTLLTLAGPIDENSEFPEIEADGSKIVLDLNGVKYINSIGIKMWIQWVTPVAASHAVEFRNCPKAIVLQMNMVKNFLPSGAEVSSFYLPLFCETCDREESILLNVGADVEVTGDAVNIKADLAKCIGCDKSDCEVEIDVIEKKYFRFLKGTV